MRDHLRALFDDIRAEHALLGAALDAAMRYPAFDDIALSQAGLIDDLRRMRGDAALMEALLDSLGALNDAPGADPTGQVEAFARRHLTDLHALLRSLQRLLVTLQLVELACIPERTLN